MARRVLITGASTGIGRAVARRLTADGWDVLGTARTDDDLAALKADGVTALRLEMTDAEDVARVAEAVAADGLDALVNNAGVGVMGPVEMLPAAAWRRQFEVNVFGHMELTRRLLPSLRAHRGRIVFLSSLAGRISLPMMGAYCASKFALEAAADALRMEVHRDGIRVSLIEPGPVATEFQATAGKHLKESTVDADRSYDAAFDRLARDMMTGWGNVKPQRVVRKVRRALVARWPKARYRVGFRSSLSVRLSRFVPRRVRDAILRRNLRV